MHTKAISLRRIPITKTKFIRNASILLLAAFCLTTQAVQASTWPGSMGKAADSTSQACLQYNGAAVFNSFCSSSVTVYVPVSNLAVNSTNEFVSARVYSTGANSVNCQAVVRGLTGGVVSQTLQVSSTVSNTYETLKLGSVFTNGDGDGLLVGDAVFFKCTVGPGAGILSVFYYGT
jgi:hypothetical protein